MITDDFCRSTSRNESLTLRRTALAGVIAFLSMLGLSLSSGAFWQASLQSLRHADHSTKTGRSIRILAVSGLAPIFSIPANTASPDVCQPAISKPVIAVTFAANSLTDPYLILIPIPMLWKSSLKLLKKVATTVVLSAGVFVLVCATLKSIFILVVSLDIISSYDPALEPSL